MTNISLIGCGKWANNYIKNINNLKGFAQITRCHSTSKNSYLNLTTKPDNNHEWSDNPDDTFNDKDTKAVIIATSPESHYNLARSALLSGKHVLCEKPFTLGIDQAIELNNIAKDSGLCLVVDYIHLWNTFYQRVKAFKPAEDINNISFIVNEPKSDRKYHSVLWDWVTHDIAMASHLFGCLTPGQAGCIFDEKKIIDSRIMSLDLRFGGSKCSIWVNTNSNKKSRKIIANYNDGSHITTTDTFEFNALREVIIDFVNAVDNNIVITNAPLAIEVTKIIQSIERAN